MIRVLDASVALKWFFRVEDELAGAAEALQLLAAVEAGEVKLVEPPHFLAEMAAVLARKDPRGAQDSIRDLLEIEVQVWPGRDLYLVAADLAGRTGTHVFDALYHATALHFPAAEFVTADRRYYERARHLGQVRLLSRL